MTTAEQTHETQKKHEFSIIVDGTKHEVPSDEVSSAEVVDLAYPGQRHDPQYKFTVTYRHSAEKKHDGTLVAGRSVKVKKEGTVFNVTRTTKS